MADNFWLNQQPWLPTNQGGPNGGGGGYGNVDAIAYRDPLDAARSGALGYGRIGQADYPDGYLDDPKSRREDRLQTGVMGRLTDRSYQRGVHKGVKMDAVQYFWPEEFNMESRLRAESVAQRSGNVLLVQRQGVQTDPVELLRHGANLSQLTDQEKTRVYSTYGINPAENNPEREPVDPVAAKFMRQDLPAWSW